MTFQVVVFVALCVLCFLYALNLYLRGQQKQTIESCLGLLILAVVLSSFFMLGWKWGLLALVSPFLLVGLSRPIAQMVAGRMLGYRTGVDDGQDETDVFAQLTSGANLYEVMSKVKQEAEARRQRLTRIARRPEIVSVLSQYQLPLSDFEEIFDSLWTSTLHDLAWEIVGQPADLEALLRMRKEGKGEHELWAHFRGLN